MEDIYALADSLGPAKVIHVYQPHLGLKGVLVVDNVATGPSIGGLRVASDVSTVECARLASHELESQSGSTLHSNHFCCGEWEVSSSSLHSPHFCCESGR